MFEPISDHNGKPVIVKSKDGKQIQKFSDVKALEAFEFGMFSGYSIEGDHVVVSAKDEFFELTPGLS